MMASYLLFIIISLTNFGHADKEMQTTANCVEWFKDGDVEIGSEDCKAECSILTVDMGTFICPEQCEALCQPVGSSLPGKLLYYPGLTPAEKKLVERYPKSAIVVFVQKTRAEMSSGRNFPSQGLNDESDAFRHFIWAGLLTKELGKKQAKQFLDAHEANRLQKLNEKQMDLHNNNIGQEAAASLIKNKNWSLESLETKGLKALKTKTLKVLNPGLNIPEKPR